MPANLKYFSLLVASSLTFWLFASKISAHFWLHPLPFVQIEAFVPAEITLTIFYPLS
jgi:hypothetical protein